MKKLGDSMHPYLLDVHEVKTGAYLLHPDEIFPRNGEWAVRWSPAEFPLHISESDNEYSLSLYFKLPPGSKIKLEIRTFPTTDDTTPIKTETFVQSSATKAYEDIKSYKIPLCRWFELKIINESSTEIKGSVFPIIPR
jgi:hypothetical protein